MQIQNRIRQRLAARHTVTGMMLFTGSPMMIEMMAAAGVDFVIIDMEHSALALERGGHLARGIGDYPYEELGCPTNAELVQRCADLGRAAGREPTTTNEARAMLGVKS